MSQVDALLGLISSYVWGVPLLVLLLGTHIFLTIRLRFIQRYLGTALRLSFRRSKDGVGDISHFAALTTALAATIGTGNIVGVGAAIAAGGPGAVLWMWLTGVFGISTKYGEALLSVKYRITTDRGEMAGGPMYVLERGLNARWLGILFAVFAAIAAFGIGNAVQANSIAVLVKDTANIEPWITGLVLSAISAAVILGGIKSIARASGWLVPFMAIFYIVGCVLLLILGYKTIPDTIELICTSAFTGQAALGGFIGASMKEAIRFGVSRGLFSNESGLGSAPIVAAAAQTRNPVQQALVSSTGTFWDTVVVCLLTGLVVVNSGEWMHGQNGALLVKTAFGDFGMVGTIILNIALFTFVFSTILGWSYYGEKALEYLFGTKAIFPYRIAWVIVVFLGSVFSLKAVWDFADIANGLMAIPNLISLLLLQRVIVSETKKYLWSGNLDLESE